MRTLADSGKIIVDKMIGVYCGTETYHFDGVDVLPVMQFLKMLHGGEIF